MKAGWKSVKVRDVCQLINGRAYSQPELLDEGKYRVLRVGNFFTNNHWYYSNLELEKEKYCSAGDLLYAWSASFGPRIWTSDKVIFHYHIWKVVPDSTVIDQVFLFMFLLWDMERIKEEQGTGTTMTHVSKGSMEDRDIQIPPLSEQRRIVGILGEAFDCIATAKANAEKNLQNARALFESHLQSVFTQRGEGWSEKPISQCFAVRSGDFLPAKAMVGSGGIDVYGGNGINGRHDEKNLSGENIIIGRVGAKCGNVRHVRGDVWVTDNAFFISEYYHPFDLGFLARVLDRTQLRSTANQAAQPVISYSTIKNVTLRFPASVQKQKDIAAKLNVLEAQTQRLESIYQQKLAALDALKKSLLDQAFTGAL